MIGTIIIILSNAISFWLGMRVMALGFKDEGRLSIIRNQQAQLVKKNLLIAELQKQIREQNKI